MIPISDIYPVDPGIHKGNYMAGLVRSILMRSNFEMHQRQVLGWKGLRPSCMGGDGWTCRIEGKEGVYGIFTEREEESGDGIRGTFRLCYFPEHEEEIIDQYSIQAALYTQFGQYNKMVRDFLSYPDFYRWFEIGEVSVYVSADRSTLWTSLSSPEHMQISCTDEIREWIGSSSTLPVQLEELNQDLLAFDLAFSFFDVLVSTIAESLDNEIEKLVYGDLGDDKMVGAGFGKEDYTGSASDELYQWEPGLAKTKPFPEARWWSPGSVSGRDYSKTFENGDENKPELIVLTGFLGSGKTTFLKEFIEYHVSYNRFVAVIQNEIGAQGLDGKLLEDDYAVMEMDEGCVCCSLIGQLKKGILKILDDHHPDIIVLETTGLANPYNLLAELDDIKDLIRFESVCSLVDGKNFFHSADYSDIALDQVKAADQIILNKIDLLTGDQQAALINSIQELNPDADIHPCSYGKVNPSLLTGRSDMTVPVSGKCEAHHDHSEEGISSRKHIIKNTLDRQYLLSEIENLPESIFRVKGVVDIKGQDAPCVVQYVNGYCSLEEMTLNIPKERFLVFIGKTKALNQQTIFFN